VTEDDKSAPAAAFNPDPDQLVKIKKAMELLQLQVTKLHVCISCEAWFPVKEQLYLKHDRSNAYL
jgi:sulfur relay (sulfurtransferase) complex TusBCD TusD component (DsrE family)